ncbi:MAG: phosphotransferase [bacterium]
MKRPRKAILLAAGLGLRMRPLTNRIPKAMLPLWGKPMLGYVIDLVRSWGVREILVNAHHAPDPLVQYLRNRTHDGMIVNISFEPDLLGTGGALKRASWFPDNEPFWIVNTDIAADVSPLPFLAAFREHSPIAAVWIDARTGPRTVEIDNYRITDFRSRTSGSAGTYTFCGVQLVSPSLLRYLPDGNAFSLVEIYENAMAAGQIVRGVEEPQSYWSDLGTPERYRKAHGEILKRFLAGLPGGNLMHRRQVKTMKSLLTHGISVTGFASVGSNTVIGRGTRIIDSVIWSNTRIKPGSLLSNSIIADGAAVSGHVEGVAAPCNGGIGQTEFGQILRRIGWNPDKTTAISLGARGSDRSFTHLQTANNDAILVQHGLNRPENSRYASHARFLALAGVPVPRILADSPADRVTLMEYFAGPSLELLARTLSADALEKRYRSVLRALLVMHTIPSRSLKTGRIALEPRFSAEIYAWERELMARHFMQGRLHMHEPGIRKVSQELESVAAILTSAPSVLIHRDFQSSNILWRHERPVFIDFQGMRLGPAVYDLASLLCDPYVMLPAQAQSRLLEYYAGRTKQPAWILNLFWLAAVQRLAQALGAFARLGAIPETRHFARHIRPGLVMMNRALAHVDGLDSLRMLVREQLLAEQAKGADKVPGE